MDARTLLLARDQWTRHATDALVLVLPAASEHWDLPEVLRTRIDEAVADGDFEPKVGKAFAWYRPVDLTAHRLWVVIAATDEVGVPTAQGVGKAMTVVAEGLKSSGAKQVDLVWGGQGEWTAEAVQSAVTSWLSAQYVYRLTKPSAPAPMGPQKLRVAASRENAAALKAGLKRAVAIAAGVELARECANRPGNHGTPTVLAREAQALGKAHGVDVEVLDRKAVEKLGMGAFLSVAKGSDEPLQFIVLRYMGAAKKDAPIVLVGKGITFDTGGISIKPSAEMDEMKFDMGGAASVLGTFRAVAELKPKVNLIGLIPACENMPSGRATKPGDVVTSMSGKTIEVLNTDAEGRLILCDALTYAERFKPAVVIDIATLTGACVIALGAHRSGLFSPDDALAAELLAAGEAAQDPAWRMPLDDAYDDALKSNFADMGNVGPRAGGAITAAMFLKRFTGAYRWAHLDIAGTAWKSGAAKGGTGRPVPLLTQFVLSCAA